MSEIDSELDRLLAGSPASPDSTPSPDAGVVGPPAQGDGLNYAFGDPQYPYYVPGQQAPEAPATGIDRSHHKQWLSNPVVRDRIIALTKQEVGGQGPGAQLKFMESLFNRSDSRFQGDVMRVLNQSDYYPNLGSPASLSNKDRESMGPLLERVVNENTNESNYATGNSSFDPKTGRVVGFNKGVETSYDNGEHYGVEGPDMAWAQGKGFSGQGGATNAVALASAKPKSVDDELDTLLGKPGQPTMGVTGAEGGPGVTPPAVAGSDDSATKEIMGSMNRSLADLIGYPVDVLTHVADIVSSKMTGDPTRFDWKDGMPGPFQQDVRDAFKSVGINIDSDMTRRYGKMGQNMFNGLATIVGMQAALPKIATQVGAAGMPALRAALQSVYESIKANPFASVMQDLGASAGSTVGEEKGGPLGAAVGGIIGGISTTPIEYATRKLGRVGMGIAERIGKAATGLVEANAPASLLAKKPNVAAMTDPQILGLHQRATQEYDGILENIDRAAASVRQLRKEKAPVQAQYDAQKELFDLQGQRRAIESTLNDFEKALPPDVRTKVAIRPAWADPNVPRRFAEEQVAGQLQSIEDAVTASISKLPPPEKVAGDYSIAVRKGLEEAEKYGRNVESAMWQRTPLKAEVPTEGLTDMLNKQTTEWAANGTHRSFIPTQFVNDMKALINPVTATGMVRLYKPTVQELTSLKTAIRQARFANQIKGGPAELGANMVKLEQMINKGIADALPGDISIQQARAISTKYHDLFSRSNLYDVLASGKRGVPKVYPEQTIPYLMDRYPGLQDILTMTRDKQMWKRTPGQPDAYPYANVDGQGPVMADGRKQIEHNAENAIVAGVNEQFKAANYDPAQMSKIAGQVAEKARPFARVAVGLDKMSQELASHVEERKMIEKSALYRYIQADPANAVRRIFAAKDPTKEAASLMRTFVGDPDAKEGFVASVIDESLRRARIKPDGVDPQGLHDVIHDPRWEPMIKSVLGDRYARLDRLTKIAIMKENGDLERLGSYQRDAIMFLGRNFGATHLGHITRRIMNLIPFGGGGGIQSAQYGAAVVKKFLTEKLASWDAGTTLHNAIRNPDFENFMLSSAIPKSPQEVEATVQTARRAVRNMVAVEQAAQSYWNGMGQKSKLSDDEKAGIEVAHAIASQYHVNPEGFQAMLEHGGQAPNRVEDRTKLGAPEALDAARAIMGQPRQSVNPFSVPANEAITEGARAIGSQNPIFRAMRPR